MDKNILLPTAVYFDVATRTQSHMESQSQRKILITYSRKSYRVMYHFTEGLTPW